jgi:hypothetical protein
VGSSREIIKPTPEKANQRSVEIGSRVALPQMILNIAFNEAEGQPASPRTQELLHY